MSHKRPFETRRPDDFLPRGWHYSTNPGYGQGLPQWPQFSEELESDQLHSAVSRLRERAVNVSHTRTLALRGMRKGEVFDR